MRRGSVHAWRTRRRELVAAVLAVGVGAAGARAATVTWTKTSGNWDTTSDNWSGGSPVATRFVNGDAAVFNNSNGSVTIASGIAPLSTTVGLVAGSINTFTFSGAGLQSGTLTKSGYGTLVLTNANTFTGDTTVGNRGAAFEYPLGGNLVLDSAGGNALSGDLRIGVPAPALGGVAKVALNRSNQIADDRVVYFDSPNPHFAYLSIRGHSETVAGIHSTASGAVIENANYDAAINTNGTLTVAPAANTTYTFSGIIRDADTGGAVDGTGKLNLVMNGPGTQVIGAGTYTYEGTTVINGGTLQVNGFLSSTQATVNNTGRLGGSGGVGGNISVASGGRLSPGAGGVGTFATLSSVAFSAGAVYQVDVDLDNTPGSDLLTVPAGVTLGGATLELNQVGGAYLGIGMTFLIITNDGSDAVTGTFGSIVGLSPHLNVIVNYAFSGLDFMGRTGSGNDVAITITPEPSGVGVVAVGGLLIGRRKRRGTGR